MSKRIAPESADSSVACSSYTKMARLADLSASAYKWTPCDTAAYINDTATVRRLIEASSIDSAHSHTALTALLISAAGSNHETTHWLCEWAAVHWRLDEVRFFNALRGCCQTVPTNYVALTIAVAAAFAVVRATGSDSDAFFGLHFKEPMKDSHTRRGEQMFLQYVHGVVDSLPDNSRNPRPPFDPEWPSMAVVLSPILPFMKWDTSFDGWAQHSGQMAGVAPSLSTILAGSGMPIHTIFPLEKLGSEWWAEVGIFGMDHFDLRWRGRRRETWKLHWLETTLSSYVLDWGVNPCNHICAHTIIINILEHDHSMGIANCGSMLHILLNTLLPPHCEALEIVMDSPGPFNASLDQTGTLGILNRRSEARHKSMWKIVREHHHALTLQERCIWRVHALMSGAATALREEAYAYLPLPLLNQRFKYLSREFGGDAFVEPQVDALAEWTGTAEEMRALAAWLSDDEE